MKQRISKTKHTNIRITHIIILLPKIMSPVQVSTEMIMIRKHKLKHRNITIIQIRILPAKIM